MDLRELRDGKNVRGLAHRISELCPPSSLALMEVCGTHTMAIARYGLRDLLPGNLRLISGPGCPVCVTPNALIDAVIELSTCPGTVITTFGDMMRVPGSELDRRSAQSARSARSARSLEERRAGGADVRVVYSPHETLRMAEDEVGKNFIFVSVGFETTTPGTALCVLEAAQRGISNVHFITANRLVIPALTHLCESKDTRIDGFLLPGHVSVVIGSDAYSPVAEKYKIPCVVAGFEPVDILMAVYETVRMITAGEHSVGNAYSRAVAPAGNTKALEVMRRVFTEVDAAWRGLGEIPASGLALRDEFAGYDALKKFGVELREAKDPAGCRCGDVLKGVILPPECKLFGTRCTPVNPVGPCMVSSEGSCAAYYKYRR